VQCTRSFFTYQKNVDMSFPSQWISVDKQYRIGSGKDGTVSMESFLHNFQLSLYAGRGCEESFLALKDLILRYDYHQNEDVHQRGNTERVKTVEYSCGVNGNNQQSNKCFLNDFPKSGMSYLPKYFPHLKAAETKSQANF